MAQAAMAETPKHTVALVSKTGDQFFVPRQSIRLSEFLSEMLDNDEDLVSIDVPEVDSNVLTIVTEFLIHYANEDPVDLRKVARIDDDTITSPFQRGLTETEFESYLSVWDKWFLAQFTPRDIFYLLQTVDFFLIDSLTTLLAAKGSMYIRNKTAEELQDQYGDLFDEATLEEAKRFQKFVPDVIEK